MKLIDVEKLRSALSEPPAVAGGLKLNRSDYDSKREHESTERVHEKAKRELSGSIEGAPREHRGSTPQILTNANENKPENALVGPTIENSIDPDRKETAPSYAQRNRKRTSARAIAQGAR
jgi:hypothetical protein